MGAAGVRGTARKAAGAGAGDDQALGGEPRQGPGDGHGADPEPLDEGAAGRELLTGRVAVQLLSELFRQFAHAATVLHESTE